MNIKYFDIASTNFNQNFPPLSQTVKEELIENEEIPQITEKPEEIQEIVVQAKTNKTSIDAKKSEISTNVFNNTNNTKFTKNIPLPTKTLNSNSCVFYPNEKNSHQKSNHRKNTPSESISAKKPSNQKNFIENKTPINNNIQIISKTHSESTNFDEKNNIFPENQQISSPEKEEEDIIVRYILNLRDYEKREEALRELSRKREKCSYLATFLWFSYGTATIFLEEIIAVYPYLSPPLVTQSIVNRINNVIGLMQICALNEQIRPFMILSNIPIYLYPFLSTSETSKNYENLRMASLSVIGALIKTDFPLGIKFLLQSDIYPLCLKIMTKDENISKTIATFIILKIITDDTGLEYICNNTERFSYLTTVLQTMLDECLKNRKSDQKLIKQIIRCYLRLSDNPQAKEYLKRLLLPSLKNIGNEIITDENTKKIQLQLLHNLYKDVNLEKNTIIFKNKKIEEIH